MMIFTQQFLNDSLANIKKKQKNRDSYRERCQSKENLPLKTKLMKLQQNSESLNIIKKNKKPNRNLKTSFDQKKYASLLVNKNSFCNRHQNKIMVTCNQNRYESLHKKKQTKKEKIKNKFYCTEYTNYENNKKIIFQNYNTLLYSTKVRPKSLKNKTIKKHLSEKKGIKHELINNYHTLSKNKNNINYNNNSFNEDNKLKK